jgi:hypothetical protein
MYIAASFRLKCVEDHVLVICVSCFATYDIGKAGKQTSAKTGATPHVLAGSQEVVAPAGLGGQIEAGVFHA